MKHTKLFSLFLASLMLASCGGEPVDDNPTVDPNPQQEEHEEEEHHEEEHKEEEEEKEEEEKSENPIEISDIFSIHTPKQKEYATGDYRTLPEGIKGSGDNSRPNPVALNVSGLFEGKTSTQYTLKLSKTTSFKSYKEYTSSTSNFSLENLNIGTAYFYKCTALVGGQTLESEVQSFFVEDEAPRNVYIDGTDNARDIGGWKVEGSNKRIPQNLIYRTANLDSITTKGRQQIADLGIKTEIDIRMSGDTTKHSTIDGVTYYNCPMENTSSYGSYTTKQGIKSAMQIFANKDNYPILFHCTAGADRTGFMSYFLNSLAGGTEESRKKDYMFTNFGNHGSRNLANITGYHTGSSLESFLLEIGVTQAEIDSIKSILTPVDPIVQGHTLSGEWKKVDETYHNMVCNDCDTPHSLLKDVHHFSEPYTKEGVTDKHFVACKDCGFEKEESHKLVFKEFITEPTASSAGKARVYCEDCGLGEQEIDLPKVTEDNYVITETVGLSDNKVVSGTSYVWKDTTYGEISGYLNAVELKHYIKIGDTYMTPSLWNKKFSGSTANEIGNEPNVVLNITVTANISVNLTQFTAEGSTNKPLDFSAYSEVVINGSGSLTVTGPSDSMGIICNNLTVDNNATVNVTASSRGKIASNGGIKLLATLTINGTLTITNFASGINVPDNTADANVTINETGSVTISKATVGIRANKGSKFTLLNKNKLSITTYSTSSSTDLRGIDLYGQATLKFTNSSETTVTSGGSTIYNGSSNSYKNLSVFVQDNAKLTLKSSQKAIENYTKFVVENENGTQCNATVSLSGGVAPLLVVKPCQNEQSLTVFDSSVETTITKTGTAGTAIKFDGSNSGTSNVIKFLSNVSFVKVTTLFDFANNPVFGADSFVTTDASGNPTIKTDSSYTTYYTGTKPENVPDSITLKS